MDDTWGLPFALEEEVDGCSEVAWDFLAEEFRPPSTAPLLEILGTEERFTPRLHVTYKEKKVLLWRVWPIANILRFCGEQDVLKMAVVSKQFKAAAYATLEQIARIKMTRFEKSGYIKFINEFAAFGQLEQHVATFGRLGFVLNDALMDREDMLLLYNTLQVTSKKESSPHCGLTPLAEFEWKARGFVHFQEYLQSYISLPLANRQRFSYYYRAWKGALDVLTLNFQLLKIRAWPVSIVRDFLRRSVRVCTKSPSSNLVLPHVLFSHVSFLLRSACTRHGTSCSGTCLVRT